MQVRDAERGLSAVSRCCTRRDRLIVDGPSQRHRCRGLLFFVRFAGSGLANRQDRRVRAVCRCDRAGKHSVRPGHDGTHRIGCGHRQDCCLVRFRRRGLPRDNAEQRANDQGERESADLCQLDPQSRRTMRTCHTPPRTRDRCARTAETHHSRDATQSIDPRARSAKGRACRHSKAVRHNLESRRNTEPQEWGLHKALCGTSGIGVISGPAFSGLPGRFRRGHAP